MKFCIDSWPRVRWIAPYRVTLYADDSTGLLPEEVFGVLELMPKFKLTMLEVAFDFSAADIDRQFVRRYALFGKSTPARAGKCTDYWGSRKGTKLVKSYDKPEIDAFRVELELHSRFVRQHHIKDPYDFRKLAQLLPHHHVYFAKIDDLKLIDHLRRRRFDGEEILGICRQLDPIESDIHAALSHLRRRTRLKNVRRLLTALRINGLVRDALTRWVENWPPTPYTITPTQNSSSVYNERTEVLTRTCRPTGR